MSEWVSVNDRLPDSTRIVLAWMPFYTTSEGGEIIGLYNVHIARFDCGSGWDLFYWEGDINIQKWMDIPNPEE